jgi:hypothetical protein
MYSLYSTCILHTTNAILTFWPDDEDDNDGEKQETKGFLIWTGARYWDEFHGFDDS